MHALETVRRLHCRSPTPAASARSPLCLVSLQPRADNVHSLPGKSMSLAPNCLAGPPHVHTAECSLGNLATMQHRRDESTLIRNRRHTHRSPFRTCGMWPHSQSSTDKPHTTCSRQRPPEFAKARFARDLGPHNKRRKRELTESPKAMQQDLAKAIPWVYNSGWARVLSLDTLTLPGTGLGPSGPGPNAYNPLSIAHSLLRFPFATLPRPSLQPLLSSPSVRAPPTPAGVVLLTLPADNSTA